MMLWATVAACMLLGVGSFAASADAADYNGRYCSGKGDAGYLRMIDQSFGFFHPNPYRQNISMLYLGKEERLCENASWYMWWVQNSYGPTYCALPFMKEPWVTALQNAQDLWFKFQGDGKTVMGFPPEPAPDGSLCDCAGPTSVIYKQGDFDTSLHKLHDWFYEATAAGVVMQAELLLVSRDMNAIRAYLPKLERACDCVERRRDGRTNLFLVGAGSNLLAPSYGGAKLADGTYVHAYLAGLSITYLAAIDRMIELEKMVGNSSRVAAYERRQRITRDSLKLLLTAEDYFVKSLETNGTKHGVYGRKEFGYFEVAPNVDAVCFRAVDDALADKIVAKTTSIPELRPYDMLITNYPSLDDIYLDQGSTSPASTNVNNILVFGKWVNGGVWTTMEARALVAYARTGRYADLVRSMKASFNFAKVFHLDAPLGDFGKSGWYPGTTGLCYDSLGPFAAVARGMFEYIYTADSLILYPHIPASITQYSQHEPIRFGEKRIEINVTNGGPDVVGLSVNGKKLKVDGSGRAVLRFADLPGHARVEIVTGGKWPAQSPALDTSFGSDDPQLPAVGKDLPTDLAAQCKTLSAMRERIAGDATARYENEFLTEALAVFDAYRMRAALNDAGAYSHLDESVRNAALPWFADACGNVYTGFETMMSRYETKGDGRQKALARVFAEVKKK